MSFLTDNQLFCVEQFGFRLGHSTELAALRLVDHLIIMKWIILMYHYFPK